MVDLAVEWVGINPFWPGGAGARGFALSCERPGCSCSAGVLGVDARMLRWAAIFLIIALIAALFGYTGILGVAVGIAKFIFFVFVVLFALALLGLLGPKKKD
jgi:uncharacterized membrane protein YtjA (UPF0391 family)